MEGKSDNCSPLLELTLDQNWHFGYFSYIRGQESASGLKVGNLGFGISVCQFSLSKFHLAHITIESRKHGFGSGHAVGYTSNPARNRQSKSFLSAE